LVIAIVHRGIHSLADGFCVPTQHQLRNRGTIGAGRDCCRIPLSGNTHTILPHANLTSRRLRPFPGNDGGIQPPRFQANACQPTRLPRIINQPGYFGDDQTHLTRTGAQAYVKAILEALDLPQ
jgi:hypothetical protein